MAHIQLVKQTSSGLLLPATPESCDFLHQIKIGEWIHADFKRVRNYAFHKRFFKLLQLGFDYWTPVGGAISEVLAEHPGLISVLRQRYEGRGMTKRKMAELLNDAHPEWCFSTCEKRIANWLAVAEYALYIPMRESFAQKTA
ncbi:DUF1133 family protein [Escherichia coli]|uniref:DUF1133 family protein n=1 Tax=Escherichia coli TaxID=562 RepID=UPI0038CC0915